MTTLPHGRWPLAAASSLGPPPARLILLSRVTPRPHVAARCWGRKRVGPFSGCRIKSEWGAGARHAAPPDVREPVALFVFLVRPLARRTGRTPPRPAAPCRYSAPAAGP